jgi:hypothetical protein
MKLYRILDAEGQVVSSRTSGQTGCYTSLESAERARGQYKNQRWYRKYGPFTIQESEEITWAGVYNYDDTTPVS